MDRRIVNFDTTWQNVQASACSLAAYAQHNQLNMPRLFGELFATYFYQRSARELLYVAYHVSRAFGTDYNTPLSTMVQMTAWVGEPPANSALMLARTTTHFGDRYNIPLFVPILVITPVAELVIDIFWNSFISCWMQDMLTRSLTQAPPHQCARDRDQYIVDQVYFQLGIPVPSLKDTQSRDFDLVSDARLSSTYAEVGIHEQANYGPRVPMGDVQRHRVTSSNRLLSSFIELPPPLKFSLSECDY
ncbi:hypothetical protein NUW58_g2574 [Xylaria curta]|uniref:Uncharacterized protein n=1 Tax=Xylaria curta TaxID=42375 RepID=A0ACC1PEV5_9PEZI|nr:hypothetical protein NUW58_g2574 [Xylaria curta]